MPPGWKPAVGRIDNARMDHARGPRRGWYLVAAGGVLAAVALVFVALGDGTVRERITAGQPVTVSIPDEGVLVWATESGQVRCAAADRRSGGWSQMYLLDLRQDALGESWRGAVLVNSYPAGTHAMTCVAAGGELAIGEPPLVGAGPGRAMGLRGAALLTVVSLVTAAVVAVSRWRAGRRAQ
jgi:hypothetical protein